MLGEHDEAASAELIRKRREMRRAYARDQETESMVTPEPSPTQSFIIREAPPIDHTTCLAHAERNFLWGMAVGGAIVLLVLPTALYLVGALK